MKTILQVILIILLQFRWCTFLNIFLLSVSFIESDSFASVSIRQKGLSKKSEYGFRKAQADMLDDNVDNGVPKTKHCGTPKLSNLSCLEG